MTRQRHFGNDTPFCAWMRAHPRLPSSGPVFGFTATDSDVVVHRYKAEVDGVGTRDMQAIMQIEVKTSMSQPKPSQLDTLMRLNMFRGDLAALGCRLRHYGVAVLVLEQTTPDDSEHMLWARYPAGTCEEAFLGGVRIRWRDMVVRPINREQLVDLLRFELHPDTLAPMCLGADGSEVLPIGSCVARQ